MQDGIRQEVKLTSEEVAFCALLARIMRRCIAEQDERIMRLLALSTNVQCSENEVTYESAA